MTKLMPTAGRRPTIGEGMTIMTLTFEKGQKNITITGHFLDICLLLNVWHQGDCELTPWIVESSEHGIQTVDVCLCSGALPNVIDSIRALNVLRMAGFIGLE